MREQFGEEYPDIVMAVAKELFKRRHGKAGDWDGLPAFVQKNYKEDAFVAVQTIRDVLLRPTDAMIDAANRSTPATTGAMIVAAINASELNVTIVK